MAREDLAEAAAHRHALQQDLRSGATGLGAI